MKTSFALLTLLLAISGCTWVEVDAKGYQVVLISQERAESCEKIGSTSASVLDNFGPFYRSEKKVREELVSIGRNQAGAMGGDAIAPATEEWNGAQTFNVYRCAD